MAIIGMDDDRDNLQISGDPGKQQHGKLIGLMGLYAPTNNTAIKQVYYGIGIQEYSPHRGFQPSDIPSPNLIRSCHLKLGAFPYGLGFSALASMCQCTTFSQNPVHAGGTCYVSTFLCQGCHNLFRGTISKTLAGGHLIQGIPLLLAERPLAGGTAASLAPVP